MRLRWALLVLLAVLLQVTVVARLPLPGEPPDLVLVLVVAAGLLRGPRTGIAVGFCAGLLADLAGDAELGRTAFALVLVGGLAGLLEDDLRGGVVVPAVAGGLGAALAVLVVAAQGVGLGDPGGASVRSLASTVPYCAALTPGVVPLVAAVVRPAARRADRRP